MPLPYVVSSAAGRTGNPGRHGPARSPGHHQRRAGVPDRDPDRRRAAWAWARRCWPASSPCWPTTSSSCRRSTPSPSPTRKTSSRCSSSPSSPSSPATWPPGSAARPCRPGCAPARPTTCTSSAASSSVAVTLDDLLWATAHQIALMLKVRVVLLLPEARHHRRARRLPARGHAGRSRPRRRQMVLGEEPHRRPRLRHAARRQVAVPAAAHRARPARRRRHHPRRTRARC